MSSRPSLSSVARAIITCERCPRLVSWRTQIARSKVHRFQGEQYWGKPVPGIGDPNARLLIVGLAPAAHGANRTGRMFTGDESGRWLYRALFKAGFCSQETSVHRNDGLVLTDCYVSAACRCAPPQNKPTREEILACRPFLQDEMRLLKKLQVILGLGKIGFDSAFETIRSRLHIPGGSKPLFGHAVRYDITNQLTLIGSYHPSQQNTFTGKLTEKMLDQVIELSRNLLHEQLEKSE